MQRLALIVAALVVMACSSSTSPTLSSTSPTSSSAGGQGSLLAGTSWRLRSIGGTPLPADVGVTLDLTPDAASGRSGCNHYVGSYAVNGAGISFAPMAVTKMACPEPQMTVEAAYLSALASATTWDVPADSPAAIRLAISGPDPALRLVFGSPD